MFQESPNAERDRLIADWQQKKQQAEALKEAELIARNKLVSFFFEEHTDKAGTENFDIGQGYKLKLVFSQNHNVPSAKNGEAVKAVIEQLKAIGPDAAFIADRLFSWAPKLSKSEYDSLPPSLKRIANKVVTTKAAQPTVEMVAPKSVQ